MNLWYHFVHQRHKRFAWVAGAMGALMVALIVGLLWVIYARGG